MKTQMEQYEKELLSLDHGLSRERLTEIEIHFSNQAPILEQLMAGEVHEEMLALKDCIKILEARERDYPLEQEIFEKFFIFSDEVVGEHWTVEQIKEQLDGVTEEGFDLDLNIIKGLLEKYHNPVKHNGVEGYWGQIADIIYT